VWFFNKDIDNNIVIGIVRGKCLFVLIFKIWLECL